MIRRITAAIFILMMLSLPLGSIAQCAMCSRVVETNQSTQTNKVGKNLNSGILYLLAVPYLIAAVGAVAWYKNRNKH